MAYIDRNNMPQERFGSSYEVLLDPLGSYKHLAWVSPPSMVVSYETALGSLIIST